MSVRKHFSVQCPFCNADIGFYRVKPRFSCPSCKSALGSNRSWVDVWAVLIYVVLAAVVWIAGEHVLHIIDASSYPRWAIGGAVVAIAAYCLLAPLALRLGPDTWSKEHPAADGGKK